MTEATPPPAIEAAAEPSPPPETLRLEVELDPAAAEGFGRLGPIAARRAGRLRAHPASLTWLDTAEGALAAEGFALERAGRGPDVLLRTLPVPGTAWRPATPPERLRERGAGEPLAEAGEAPLIPVSAFEGRRSVVPLLGGVEAVLLHGRLRAVVAEAPVARLTLCGPPSAVLALARDLAAAVPALPPRAALAEEGRALARGEAPRPRRFGPPAPGPGLGVEDALVLAIGHLAEAMLWHAPLARAGTDPTGVHQMRVALRRLRSLLKVFRPAVDAAALRALDRDLRELADLLGPARDWDVFLGGLGAELAAALPGDARIGTLLRAARERRGAAYAALRTALDGPGFRRLLWEVVAVLQARPWRDEPAEEEVTARRALPLEAFAAKLLDRRWQRLVAAGADISAMPDEALHELRLEAKRLRYPAELFAPLWGRRRGRRFLKRLAEVQEAFGLSNDVAVARSLVGQLVTRGGAGMAWAAGVAEGWSLARARPARRRSAEAWEALLETEAYWNQG